MGIARLVDVSRFRSRFVAVFVLAFWLLATQHCGLEAAGVFDSHADASQCCVGSGEEHCSHDGCELVEGGGVNVSAATKAPAPQLALLLSLACSRVKMPVLPTASRVHEPEFGRPLDWVAKWQFVQRAALAPRAPSLV